MYLNFEKWLRETLIKSLTPKLGGRMTWHQLIETLAHAISTHCHSIKHLRQLHARALFSGLRRNLHVSALLIAGYFRLADAESARRVFGALRERPTKTLLWNSLIRGYLRSGCPRSALNVYHQMIGPPPQCEPDERTFHLVVTACTDASDFELGSRVESHARARELDRDLLVATALITMHGRAGDAEAARRVFDGMPVRDVVSWNAMISVYAQSGLPHEAVNLFKDMRFVHGVLPTERTVVSLISGCMEPIFLKDGEVLHAHSIKAGFETYVFVSNSLMEMYVECNRLDLASKLFERMVLKDAVSWSTMIGAYVRYGRPDDALKLFHWMVLQRGIAPTRPILLNILRACADLGDWHEGRHIEEKYVTRESSGFKLDASLITALIYMYTKCGNMEFSLKFLNNVSQVSEDVIAWNAMIKAFGELGEVGKVLGITLEMQRRKIDPDSATFLTLLPLISAMPFSTKGMETHAHIIKRGFKSERPISNALIDMYAKCGRIEDSWKVFNGIREKDVVTWSSMIKAYAWNGNAKEVLNLFQLMREADTTPNHFTFLAILAACSHGGLVEQGRQFFSCMKEEYGLEQGVGHFACMVDMYCRAGLLNDAYQLLQKGIPEACSNAALWGTLLSACRFHGELVIGEAAATHLFLLEPGNAANYLILSDIYISAGRRTDANEVLELLKAKELERRPGFSWFDGG